MLRESTGQAAAARGADSRLGWLASRVPVTALVAAGVAMFVLYIAMDVIASLAYDGYSYRDQTISELSAFDAPTRPFWLVLSAVYQLLAFAFAFGVLAAAARRSVRIVGGILLLAAVVGLMWWLGPMHQREVLAADGGTWQDTLHLVTAGISSVFFFAMIGVGAFAFGWPFRVYSFATIALMLVFGLLMNMDMEGVSANEATPWLGIWERITVEGAMLWEAVFAAMLVLEARASRALTRPN